MGSLGLGDLWPKGSLFPSTLREEHNPIMPSKSSPVAQNKKERDSIDSILRSIRRLLNDHDDAVESSFTCNKSSSSSSDDCDGLEELMESVHDSLGDLTNGSAYYASKSDLSYGLRDIKSAYNDYIDMFEEDYSPHSRFGSLDDAEDTVSSLDKKIRSSLKSLDSLIAKIGEVEVGVGAGKKSSSIKSSRRAAIASSKAC